MPRWLLGAATMAVIATMRVVGVAAADIGPNYAAGAAHGQVPAVVMQCPSNDGTYSAGACNFGSYITGGGTIAAGGSAQIAIAANGMSHGCDLVNDSTNSEPLYFAFGAAAVVGSSVSLAPGTAYHCPIGTAQYLSVAAATTGHSYHFLGY